jgi:antitoxin component YwqK of YwqJK toxin-antitoxin module
MPFDKFFFSFLFVIASCNSALDKGGPIEKTPFIEVQKDALIRDQSNGLLLYEGELFTGRSVEKYPDGSLAEQITYLSGKKNGVHKKWFPSGTQSFEAYYIKNKREGSVNTWWGNGTLRSSSNYISGIPHGEQKEWYSSGQLFKKTNLFQGREEGSQQAWRKNGKLYNNYVAKDGRIFGLKRANLCFELKDEKLRDRN